MKGVQSVSTFIFFVCGCPVVLALFVKKTVFLQGPIFFKHTGALECANANKSKGSKL